MDNIELMDYEVMHSYQCPRCSRCFVACGHAAAGDILCVCGAKLVERPLPHGVHELRSAAAARCGAEEMERDLGYGASHGHAPGHEGPMGSGDAPADVSEGISPR